MSLNKIFSTNIQNTLSFISRKYADVKCEDRFIVTVKTIRKFIKDVMTKAGCSDENAEELATVLTMADSYGVYSNGINRLGKIFGFGSSKLLLLSKDFLSFQSKYSTR